MANSLEVGAGVLPVHVDALERPELSAPAGMERRALPLWLPYLAATPLVLGGLVCLYVVRRERQLPRKQQQARRGHRHRPPQAPLIRGRHAPVHHL